MLNMLNLTDMNKQIKANLYKIQWIDEPDGLKILS